ncbi:hypothetical protein IBE48_09745 [Francisella philomiragia]|nr:hypothetical protein [Francisella philomiragia]MBK2255727.1 hypothetical protein [Francisella philomiragia]MBK2274041.1 hypothetical protein [Francisella philomiragia]MBK2277888.1 hypothetical protein [Francisella philomiragia]MBK2281832.1 hypothetical protein [Francisella philomiragia]MBK2283782.1 hypothetical protein [Francisella philomiragia]
MTQKTVFGVMVLGRPCLLDDVFLSFCMSSKNDSCFMEVGFKLVLMAKN